MALYLAHSAEHYSPPSWSSGTIEEIAEALDKHYAGEIDLGDYWAVGDERVVSLDAMSATGVGESHVAQDVTFVIMNKGGKTLSDGTTECAFVIGQKNFLADGTTREGGYMNDTNTNEGGWTSSKRRAWCNNIYRAAIPSDLRALFKQFRNNTSAGNQSTTINTDADYFALPSEVEVDGTTSATYKDEGTQFKYYETQSNRIKYPGDSGSGSASPWWLRSPYVRGAADFRSVGTNGGVSYGYGASATIGLAPFGCI